MLPLLRFTRHYLLPYLHWYIGGTVMLAATNWIAVTIPMYLAQGMAREANKSMQALNKFTEKLGRWKMLRQPRWSYRLSGTCCKPKLSLLARTASLEPKKHG